MDGVQLRVIQRVYHSKTTEAIIERSLVGMCARKLPHAILDFGNWQEALRNETDGNVLLQWSRVECN